MNFRQLEAFRATMRLGNVTAAAKSLNVSQPSVSRLIADLEYAIGIQLFHHCKGRLNPTREAEIFFDEVDRSFVGLESLQRTARLIRNESYGQLRIGVPAALSMNIIPRVAAGFRRDNPQTFLSIRVRSSRWIVDWISGYQLDIGIVNTFRELPAVNVLRRYQTRLVLLMPRGHKLATRAVIGREDLEGQPFIGVDLPWLFGRINDDAFKQVLNRSCDIETGTFLTAAGLVHSGAGVAILDVYTAAYYENFGLVALPLEVDIPFDTIIIHAAHKSPSLQAKAFLPELYRQIEKVGHSTTGFEII